jgi:hypothetical protein
MCKNICYNLRDGFNIESILPNHGHTAIQQPPYDHDVNPTKLAWPERKRRLRDCNVPLQKLLLMISTVSLPCFVPETQF